MSLTTLDEVPNKNEFLQNIYNLSSEDTKIFIAVRNKNWLLSKNSNVEGAFGDKLKDLSIEKYKQLFRENRLDIVNIQKIPRPLFTSFTKNGIKNIIIVILEKFISIKQAYMIGFTLKRRIV